MFSPASDCSDWSVFASRVFFFQPFPLLHQEPTHSVFVFSILMSPSSSVLSSLSGCFVSSLSASFFFSIPVDLSCSSSFLLLLLTWLLSSFRFWCLSSCVVVSASPFTCIGFVSFCFLLFYLFFILVLLSLFLPSFWLTFSLPVSATFLTHFRSVSSSAVMITKEE